LHQNKNDMTLRTILLTGSLLIAQQAISQGPKPADNVENKKIQAGLAFSSGMLLTNFETNQVSSSGVGGFFGLGFGANFNLTNNLGVYTGLEFHFERFRFSPASNVDFQYDYNDRTIIRKKDDTEVLGTMSLRERRQNVVAANIPLMLMFRTNMIGYFRYFGKFGLRNSILLRQRVNDTGITEVDEILQNVKLEGMRATNDMFFLRTSAGLSVGTEWNFASSTSLSIEGGFYYGFTPIFSGNGKDDRNVSSLYVENNGVREYRSFRANQSVVEIRAVLLF
jgi:hypothetical protein